MNKYDSNNGLNIAIKDDVNVCVTVFRLKTDRKTVTQTQTFTILSNKPYLEHPFRSSAQHLLQEPQGISRNPNAAKLRRLIRPAGIK